MLESESLHTERELLLLVADSDERAFRELFDRYRDKLYSLGMHLTRSPLFAEEIVQEVFLKVWERRRQLRDIDNFNAWLRTVVRNAGLNHFRSLAIERLALSQLAAKPPHNNHFTEIDAAGREYDQILKEAIRRLPRQQQKVYLLQRQHGMKQHEIARELGISVFTVKEHMRSALRSIRGYLDGHIEMAVMIAIALYLE